MKCYTGYHHPPPPHTHPPTSAYTCINRFTSSHCEWVGEWIYILICPYGYAIVSSELYQFEVYIHTCKVIYTHSYTQHTRIRFESFDWMNLCKYVRVCVCVLCNIQISFVHTLLNWKDFPKHDWQSFLHWLEFEDWKRIT